MYILKHKGHDSYLVVSLKDNVLRLYDSATIIKYDGLFSHRDYNKLRMFTEHSNISFGDTVIDDTFDHSYLYQSVHPISDYTVVKV